jgi:hypothetical protein
MRMSFFSLREMSLVFFNGLGGDKGDESGVLPDICERLLQVSQWLVARATLSMWARLSLFWLCKVLSHQMSVTCCLSRGMSRPMIRRGSYLS